MAVSRLVFTLALTAAWPFVAGARYRQSYDAWTHMFFADHYRRDWWALWENRWYGGFPVVSYPPLVHQLIAFLAFGVGVEVAWALVLLTTLVLLPFVVSAFARRFVGSRASRYAGLLTPFIPAVPMVAHTFGQLPTLFGLTAALLGFGFLVDFLRTGRRVDGVRAGLWLVVADAAHHGTLLLVPWGVAAAALHVGRPASLARRLMPWVLGTAAGVGLVSWPFWAWALGQTLQEPIDHLSRHSFIADPAAAGVFFWPMYGPLVFVIPLALKVALGRRRRGLGLLFGVCFVLGLGGTTPLPALLFGPAWEWLTYDRFTLWASVFLAPLVGAAAVRLGRRVSQARRVTGATLLAGSALYAGSYGLIASTQPALVDPDPIVQFLQRDDVRTWRYVTFGFGDQLARLSMLTEAENIDGNYPTGRTLPFLRASGLGSLDSAYWLEGGLERLDRVLGRLSEVGVRWAFVNHPAYLALLAAHGWERRETLPNGVEVWENPTAQGPLPPGKPHFPPLTALSWGILPPLSLIAAVGTTFGPAHLPVRRRGRTWDDVGAKETRVV
ncbi:MAG: hypothetical protein C4316_10290 [Chloroflexota bacterium]